MSVDTAGRGADETGITIIYHLNSKLFIKKIIGIDGGYEDELLIQIAGLCAEHRINSLLIEENFSDGMFNKVIEPHLARISPETEIVGIKVMGQKETRIIESLEPLLNQHRLVISKEVFEYDITTPKIANSFAYQLSHLTKERGALKHDDRLDSLSNAVAYMVEWMSDDDNWGVQQHALDAAKNTLDFTLKHFNGMRRVTNLNYLDSF